MDDLRIKAVGIIAKRGVDKRTVFAHLVGKNTASTLTARKFDSLLKEWLTQNSSKLKEWYLKHADAQDKKRIENFFGQPQVLDTPKASDINDPDEANRVETTIYRILRDTALSREVKISQNYKCQLCGNRIRLSYGSFYAEAHHVRPLGRPHNGPDKIDNIICVCPTCHVLLDYKVIRLEKDQVPSVAEAFVDYHNNEMYGQK